jgi:hypothetical protein
MSNSAVDRDRVVLTAAILTGLTGLGMYFVVYLTVMQYGQLNASGQAFERVALLLTVATLMLSLYLALAARSHALTSPALSGAGWFLIAAGVMLSFPALGGTIAFATAAGVSTFSGVAGSMFLIMAGAGLLQAERNARERGDDPRGEETRPY